MDTVGRIGSYIGRGVSSVSGTFHPFGGAVDIIVVEQPDGSLKSSPWYVRFGKFQGVLKAKEKMVHISVNGVEAGFYMYLDNRGQAYFLKELDVEDGDCLLSYSSSSGEDTDGQSSSSSSSKRLTKSKSCNYDAAEGVLVVPDSRRPGILSRVFGRKSMKKDSNVSVIRVDSLESAELAADLLEMRWSTNLTPKRYTREYATQISARDTLKVVKDENSQTNDIKSETMSLAHADVLDNLDSHDEKPVEETGKHVSTSASENATSVSAVVQSVQEHDSFTGSCLSRQENGTGAVQSLFYCETEENSTRVMDLSREQGTQNLCVSHGENLEASMSAQTMLSIYDFMSEENSQPEEDLFVGKDPSNVQGFQRNGYSNSPTKFSGLEEEQLLFGNIDDCDNSVAICTDSISLDYKEKEAFPPSSSEHPDRSKDDLVPNYKPIATLNTSIEIDLPIVADARKLKTVSSNVDISSSAIVQDKELRRMAISLPNMLSHDNDLPSNPKGQNSSIVLQTTDVADVAEEVKNLSATPVIEKDPGTITSPSRRWRSSWSFSFKRAKSMKISGPSMDEHVNTDANSVSNKTGGDPEKDVPRPKISTKKIIMVTTPTSEQLATLNLKEGKNIVVFTFLTGMLGKQQVDAHIYLWRWDSKIVISDVDGTITRSDVLGQFMPLVGMDWSQTGVAHLFSAIKENGYQLLFLSARAISQAYLTRQFLFNLMQNGKGLPEGPVLTSPDGIFPSLFREVVRRAPHEFKIACLQDVKALFPCDKNPYPFYAGFGNRHTDEISYLKVGIPKGKIFTINPKGQIVVNRHIDTRSYTSLHGLVNGMFPAMSSCEQEDFNYWNYWKIPLPPID